MTHHPKDKTRRGAEPSRPGMSSWPSGAVDDALEALQQRYVPDMVHVDIPGVLQAAALGSSFGAESVVLLH